MSLKPLEDFVQRLSAFDFAAEQERIIDENKDALADLQAEQWAQSRDSNGEAIKLFDNAAYDYGYKPFTVAHKRLRGVGLGAVTDRVTLFQTGNLYKSLFTTIASGKFFLSSDLDYFDTLMQRTNDVTGLDEDQRRTFGETYTKPGMQKVVKEKLGLNF